ncbi:ALF repeat-containing protein [Streptomyces sp. NPDC001443]
MPLPDTERAKVVRAWLTAGKGVKAAAADALYGADADIQAFLAETLPRRTAEDNRVAIVRGLDQAGKGLRREVSAALDNGDAAIAAFLQSGFGPAVLEDLRVATTTVSSTGGKAVARSADTAPPPPSPTAPWSSTARGRPRPFCATEH